MPTIILDYSSRIPKLNGNPNASHFNYIYEKFKEAKSQAKADDPVIVTGIVSAKDMRKIQRKLNLFPITESVVASGRLFNVSFLINYDTKF